MNTYRLIAVEVTVPHHESPSGVPSHPNPSEHTLYIEAEDSAAATTLLAAKGFRVIASSLVQPGDVPPGVGVQRVPNAAPRASLLRDNPTARRTIFMLIGIGLGLVVIVGTLFVLKAREHLTRSDISPRVPAGTETRP